MASSIYMFFFRRVVYEEKPHMSWMFEYIDPCSLGREDLEELER
jgi:hypothetical protein